MLALLLSWLVFVYFEIVRPSVNEPRRADAIVVLGPPHVGGALSTALTLAQRGLSDRLLVSASESGFDYAVCDIRIRGIKVDCFDPVPATTRGEAEYVRAIARVQHWHSVLVVTGTYHVARARVIFDRCLTGTVQMVGAERNLTWRDWLYQIGRESGAWIKVPWSSRC